MARHPSGWAPISQSVEPERGHSRPASGQRSCPDVRPAERGRADPAEAPALLGQRARRVLAGRCGGRGCAVQRRRHLLCHDLRALRRHGLCIKTLETGRITDLALARKLFMKEHKTVFPRSGPDAGRLLQKRHAARTVRVSLCHDVDVQKLTFEAYMNKKLVKARPMAHMKIGFKNARHLRAL